MSATPVDGAFPVFNDLTGAALNAGKIYIGVAGSDPQTTPTPVWWDAAQTLPATQPLRTIGGYIVNNGAPATVFVAVDYSMRVRDRNDVVVSYSALAGRAGNLFDSITVAGNISGASLTISGDATVDDIVSTGTVTVINPNVGTFGGFRLRANITSGFGYFQALSNDGLTEWSHWRYASTGEARLDGILRVLGAASTAPVTQAAAATTTIDCTASNAFRVTMGLNVTTLTLNNPTDGQAIVIDFIQDATGSRTIAWPSTFRWSFGTAGTLSTTAGLSDKLTAIWNGATWQVVLTKAFAA